jgi:phospholipase/carboxylesterase
MPNLNLPLTFQHREAARNTDAPWLLILMHGVGSNDDDLFGLAPHVPPRFHVLSLQAPYMLGPDSYAWFQFGQKPNGDRVIDEAQELVSRNLVAQTVDAAAKQLGVPPARLVVGGFSQGGIMSLTLLLTQPALLHAVLVLHSRLLPQALAVSAPMASLAGRKAWVSHGVHDNVIPLASAHAMRAHLVTTPVELSYAEFPGMHEIRPAELQAAMAWLDALSSSKP